MSEDIDYNKSNQLKVHWHETDVYEFERDNNKGFVYGIVRWYGDRTVGEAIDEEADGVYWEWWKTEEKRDKEFLNNLPYSKSDWDIDKGEN